MTQETDAVLTAALALSPEARATLAEKLLDSLREKTQGEIDAAWAEEAKRRIEAFERGEMEAIPAEVVFDAHPPAAGHDEGHRQ
ncbi:MAG: addiction module protein [Gemmataceae bacterium]|nr:addiction module protein [Gemmataceae bacterium]